MKGVSILHRSDKGSLRLLAKQRLAASYKMHLVLHRLRLLMAKVSSPGRMANLLSRAGDGSGTTGRPGSSIERRFTGQDGWNLIGVHEDGR